MQIIVLIKLLIGSSILVLGMPQKFLKEQSNVEFEPFVEQTSRGVCYLIV